MKRFGMFLMVVFTCLSLFSTVAEAKRFGGGSSFGKQRAVPTRQAQQAPTPAPAPAAAPAPAGNRWLGPLAGLAIGAGLASMFAGNGMGGAMGPMLMMLLVAGIAMLLVSRLKKPEQSAMRYAGNVPEPAPQPAYVGGDASSAAAPADANIPADFPVESFLRNARISFIRLQAANDRKDLNDIREYTTPEMFAEIAMQLQERGDAAQRTDVLTINAELLEVVTEGDYAIASVRFVGQLRENDGIPENVDEIWHVQRNLRDEKSTWLLAGIQQTVLQ